jgi:hypothetical protein
LVRIEVEEDEFLAHYGMLRRSGRYPWGSGEDAYERNKGFLGYVDDLKKQGLTDAQIAKGLSDPELGIYITSTQIRAAKSIAASQNRKSDSLQAMRLKTKGMSNSAIGRQMGINESSVRSLLDPMLADKQDILESTANQLKESMGDGYLDIGAGTENHLGISSTKLNTAVAYLKEQGYTVRNIQQPQLGTNNKTTIKTLVPPNAPKFIDPTKIKTVAAYSEDGGRSFKQIVPPKNIDSKRVAVRFAEQGGADADGVIYVRPGVDDVSLGAARYAQVRIAVDGTHYLKGMAVYKDDLPAGVDLQFNTNKSSSVGKLGAMKPQKDDPENRFGSAIDHQKYYTDKNGKEQLGVMNIVNEEGSWSDWSRTLSSQFLSKQSASLASKQLDAALDTRKTELDEINSLTNPVIKKKLLTSYADGTESASVQLKAAAIKGQSTSVILPFDDIKENEIYAPNYQNGDKVVLVRFPHGGTFEIPELTVNNKTPTAKKTLGASGTRGAAPDAVGIHPKTAARLSGADFDGDTVLVIPNNDRSIKTSAPLAGLKGFDPQSYKIDRASKDPNSPDFLKDAKTGAPVPARITSRAKQMHMGDVSNLITDMTVKGAKPDELARAVRHSMVVIDAEKHDLDYKSSYSENGIASLKATYQGVGSTGRLKGASTIISRSGNATTLVPEKRLRKASEGGPIDLATGKRVFVDTGATRTVSTTSKKTGEVKTKEVALTTKSKPLLETDDARTLVSDGGGTPIEFIYANHSNAMKSLSDAARKSSTETGSLKYSPTAAKAYGTQVNSLNAKLNVALKNKPLERQAQILANAAVSQKTRDNPGMDNADLKKIKGQELTRARSRVGAEKQQIEITDDEWSAIQAGAISSSKLSQIVDNTDLDKLKARALPRQATVMTPQNLARAHAMLDNGATQAEIARALGVPVTTLNSALLTEGS